MNLEIYPHLDLPPVLDLKFRQIKCLALHRRLKKICWFVLNRKVNFPITNLNVNRAIDAVQKEYRILRMYQTASEFYNPVWLGKKSDDKKYLNTLLSSWMVIESDQHINYSLQLAHYVYSELIDRSIEPIIYSTGGKSIHLLFEFNYKKFLSPKLRRIDLSTKSWDMPKRIWIDKIARWTFLNRIIPDTEHDKVIDWKTALDVRRVVPIINTRNVLKGSWITQLEPEELLYTSDYVWNKAAKSINFTFEQLENDQIEN